ncbi:MAG: hypothetical protein A3F12_05070 [Gammaproteobacteria bacterium RIFCSPHIGHO2_12_FULL_38_14]|nr:MAG: hypothetical protein A3F12_05070 [Gammaproteobacteria bacterium RIFCSPHIGHO2_12_FULL_38_14]
MLSILVTRPGQRGLQLCKRIEAEGDQAIYLPTIDFAPYQNQKQLTSWINQLDEQDVIIFTSERAVIAFFDLYFKKNEPIPVKKIAAVGRHTAKLLEQKGFNVIYPQHEAGSEGLLHLPQFTSVAHEKIMLITGENGRDFLEKTLRLRGALVTSMFVYKRILPLLDSTHVAHAFKQRKIDAIIAASFDSVHNLKILLHDVWPLLLKVPLIVVSERIKILAKDLGFQTIWVTRDTSLQAFIDMLEEKRIALCQIKKKMEQQQKKKQ